jgi:hypothetical protein
MVIYKMLENVSFVFKREKKPKNKNKNLGQSGAISQGPKCPYTEFPKGVLEGHFSQLYHYLTSLFTTCSNT